MSNPAESRDDEKLAAAAHMCERLAAVLTAGARATWSQVHVGTTGTHNGRRYTVVALSATAATVLWEDGATQDVPKPQCVIEGN